MARINAWYGIGRGLVVVLLVAACAVPVLACTPVAHALAGRQTTLTITVSFIATLTIGVTLAGMTGLFARKTRMQAGQLKRLRARLTKLERERDELRTELRALRP